MLQDYAADAGFCYRAGLVRTVQELGLKVITGAKCREVTQSGVIYEKDGAEHLAEGDTVLYAAGMKPNDRLYRPVRQSAFCLPGRRLQKGGQN